MKSLLIKVGAAVSVLIVGAAVFVLVTGTTFQKSQVSAQATPPVLASNVTTSPTSVSQIYAAANPAVVEINVTSQSSTGIFGGSFTQSGQGSGFVVDSNGDIVTNEHVVDGATSVQVTFSNGKTVSATVAGTDTADDLAVVKVSASAVAGIAPLTLADSSSVVPGESAIAIGSPYGLTNSVTLGIVSGLNRTLDQNHTDMIQTDADIQPGNSGGPLLNSAGQVIGVNTAIEGQGTGIGFAIPSNVVSRVLTSLENGKQVTAAWIGISGLDLTQSQAQSLGLGVSQGVYVITVVPGGPADSAGLKGAGTSQTGAPGTGGDVITAIDGQPVTSVADLQNYLANKSVGDTVTLTVVRGGSTMTVAVTLGARPANTSSSSPSQQSPGNSFPWSQIPVPWGGR